MTPNVGKIDRILRALVGAVLLGVMLTLEGSSRWIGLVGVVLLVTSAFSFCPAYALIRVNTASCGCGKGHCTKTDAPD